MNLYDWMQQNLKRVFAGPEPMREELIVEDEPLTDRYVPYTLEIGEIPTRIKAIDCCGVWFWYGVFPDGTLCCEHGACHSTSEEAEGCARKRVRNGFIFRKVYADE